MTDFSGAFGVTVHEPSTAAKITRSMLGYGVIAGPFYLGVYLVQGLVREGFDFTRHAASLLTVGAYGWIQVVSFIVTGAMVVVAAIGLLACSRRRRASATCGRSGCCRWVWSYRAMPSGRGRTWGPLLLGVHGVGMVVAGIFPADAAYGFPVGTPDGPGEVSWHGLVHFAAGGVGFLCFIAACFVFTRRFSGLRERGWAVFSTVTGVVFLAGFVGIASGSAGPVTTLPFVAAVVLSFVWLSTLSAWMYREQAYA